MIPDLTTQQLVFLFGSFFILYLILRSLWGLIQYRKKQSDLAQRLEESQNRTQTLFKKMEENRLRFNSEMENLRAAAESFENHVNEVVNLANKEKESEAGKAKKEDDTTA